MRTSPARRAAAVAAAASTAVLLAAVPGALAAQVDSFSYGPNACGDVQRFQFVAGPGETNRVVVGSSGERRIGAGPATSCPADDPFALPNFTTFADLANPVATGSCTQLSGFSAICAGDQVIAVLVLLRDGDDSAVVANTRVKAYVHGEQGNDTISVRNGRPDEVYCGEGTDTVFADTTDLVNGCEVVNPV